MFISIYLRGVACFGDLFFFFKLYMTTCVGIRAGSGAEASRLCMDKVATGAAIAHVCTT